MEPTEVLKAALQAVNDAGVPSDLREIAFTRAVDMFRGETAKTPGSGADGMQSGNAGGGGSATDSNRLKKVADALGVPYERIEMLFVEHEDGLQVAADPGALGASTKERAKGVALLVAAGRQLGGWDEGPTSDLVVRAEVDRLGVYDGTNYAKHVKDLSAWFNVNGVGKSATYKLKFPGREHLKKVAKDLVGE
jgi:hypothetical protein